MSLILARNGKSSLAATLIVMSGATPALAESTLPARDLPVPIIPPPFVVVPDPNAAATGLAPDRLTLVVGAGIGGDYEGSDDYVFGAVAGAAARFHGHSIAWEGNSLGMDLIPEYRNQTFKFSLAPFINVNLDGAGTAHDPVVARIRKRKKAVEGGVQVGFTRTGIFAPQFDSLTVQISGAYDLGSVHRSFILRPSVIYTAPLSRAVLVSVSASLDLVGSDYARYYFGIDSDASASSGLPLYRPGGGVKSAAFGLGGAVSLNGDLRRGFAVGAKVRYERLLGDFANSPLVAMRGNSSQFNAAVGVAYTF